MTWNKPPQRMDTPDSAVRWWLAEHFTAAATPESAVWAIDLYASYVAAAVEHAMPLFSVRLFAGIVQQLAPKTGYRTVSYDGVRRGGHQYMVTPKKGVTVVAVGNVAHGAIRAALILKEALDEAGAAQSWEWGSWQMQKENDTKAVVSFLATKGWKGHMGKDDAPGREMPCKQVFGDFIASGASGWTYTRFNRALASVARIRRGCGGARKVALLQRLDGAT